MKVADLKVVEPEAELYELRPGAKYLITLPPPMTADRAAALRRALTRAGVEAILLEGTATLTELRQELKSAGDPRMKED